MLVASNKFIREDLLDALIEERYIEEKEEELNAFKGVLTNPLIDDNIRQKYYYAFNNLDNDFLKIKRRDSEYVSYEQGSSFY